jgi:hypothetical protein
MGYKRDRWRKGEFRLGPFGGPLGMYIVLESLEGFGWKLNGQAASGGVEFITSEKSGGYRNFRARAKDSEGTA